jgi:hypothetical protein
VTDQAAHERDIPGNRLIAESLARATNTPLDHVAEIYARESAELERTSRVKSFIGIIATRRTRAILRKRSGKRPTNRQEPVAT